jgi:hypothetical protein
MKRLYRHRNFRPAALGLIKAANQIIAEYQAAGYSITLRQLYYQFVSRDLLPNKQEEYKRLGDVINDARLAGLVDWEAIEDRGRYPRENAHWDSPQDIIDACSRQFRFEKWANQPKAVEVWVEKDALIGIVEQVAREEDCVAFSCRGYSSATAIYNAEQRILKRAVKGQSTTILHLGDHDPSGMHMTEDVRGRIEEMLANDWYHDVMVPKGLGHLSKFSQIFLNMEEAGVGFSVERIALNMDQVEEYNPPPNPAKETDARFKKYQAQYGDESWELDALDPTVLADLIRTNIEANRVAVLWEQSLEEERKARLGIKAVAKQWEKCRRHAEWLSEDAE